MPHAPTPESRQSPPMASRPTFLEFFAGGGMARAGPRRPVRLRLRQRHRPDEVRRLPRQRSGRRHRRKATSGTSTPPSIPAADLAWASFPCQDLSLAGGRRGLNAPRSGAFWGFWNIIEKQGRAARPRPSCIENVAGLLSSHGGRDFATLVTTLADAGYRVGAMLIDAALFSPQSRQRLFIIAHKGRIPPGLVADAPDATLPSARPARRRRHAARPRRTSPGSGGACRIRPAATPISPPCSNATRPKTSGVRTPTRKSSSSQMAPLHRQRVEAALADPRWKAGAVYRRIRIENGERIQRAEIRYDGMAGCLRTPAGGSSKQLLLVTENGRVRLRPAARPRSRPPDGPARQLPAARGRNQRAQGHGRWRLRPRRPLARTEPARAAHRSKGAKAAA